MDVASVFAEPLVDLGTESPAFAGIYAPQSSIGAAKVGVTSQFLENAEQYHRAYFDTGYWNFLLGNALEAAGKPSSPGRIIDIGSGSGNSVIPLADRFPDAEIIATDISPQLLAILRDFLRQRSDGEQRFGLICVDAMAAQYQEEVAGLAVGAAILHHILEPERVLASCFHALAPGGWAIFFEPCFDLVDRERTGEEKSLQLVAALIFQKRHLFLSIQSLGYDFQPKSVGHAYDSRDDGAVVGIVRKVFDEATIDLESIQGEALQ